MDRKQDPRYDKSSWGNSRISLVVTPVVMLNLDFSAICCFADVKENPGLNDSLGHWEFKMLCQNYLHFRCLKGEWGDYSFYYRILRGRSSP